MRQFSVLRVVAKLLTPLILLFALYVQFHGDLGPGGGFQAGVIFAVGFILYGLVFGVEEARRIARPGLVRAGIALGVLIYGGVGVIGLLLGRNYLDYSVLAAEPAYGHELGIGLIELGVGITVASVMVTIFFSFADRGRPAGAGTDGQDGAPVTLGHYNYWIFVALMMIGFYTVIARENLVKKMIGLGIFQVSVFVLYISMGYVEGGTAPILGSGYGRYANPLPSVLILTAIVVGVATTALGLALVVRIREAYGTVEESEIQRLDDEAGPSDPPDPPRSTAS